MVGSVDSGVGGEEGENGAEHEQGNIKMDVADDDDSRALKEVSLGGSGRQPSSNSRGGADGKNAARASSFGRGARRGSLLVEEDAPDLDDLCL
uniref:Uncharacterized protein n=1 Tax=Erythrolobus madagascarensis TaxID=708628 RepID=A0A6T9YWP8_9RHOD